MKMFLLNFVHLVLQIRAQLIDALGKKDISAFTPLETACVNQKYLVTMQMRLCKIEVCMSSFA